jgi:hypothetical protein
MASPSNHFNVSGVSLGLEDLALLDQLSPATPNLPYSSPPVSAPAPMPMSAPAWQTSFDVSTPFDGYQQSYTHMPPQFLAPSYGYSASPQSYLMDDMIPRSAPAFHEYGIPDYFSMPEPVPSNRRRGSSIDSAIIQALPPSSSSSRIHSELPSPTIRKIRSRPTSLKKAGRRGSAPAAQAQFVNFTSADSHKLLTGVAPSGSSKRKRDEVETKDASKRRVVSA